ncbi:MAG: 16S rRNA (cytosine(967)-C(5))-methyltransferase RsmB, partial [Clostridia bacterium]|nr:16S rRNA (cytosine(967)-C(5))-methyltransferase RsmB [Clostridia bacterium]
GVYQMLYLDKIPDRAAVNEMVNLAKKYGHPGTVKLVNGVLRNISRNRENIKFPSRHEDLEGFISIVYSHPRWLVKRWLSLFGAEDTEKLCSVNNQAPPVTVRTNTLRTSRDRLMERLTQEEIDCRPGRFTPESIILDGVPPIASLPSFREGLFQVQDESSMLVAHVLGAKPGSNVLDVCAAPGGKTTHIGQLMNNQGRIKAFDIHQHKLDLVKDNCRRLGIEIVETCAGDSRHLPNHLKCWADYVLVDAPCSGLGVLRRRPDARWNKEENTIKELVPVQEKILLSAARTVKPGGVLVYSTCTISPEENEEMIKWFLETNEEFALEPLDNIIAFFQGEEEILGNKRGMIQMLPYVHGTDGLFIARLRRRERG